ncbi:putative NIT2-nitrilase [Mycotypha africana]|uniref:putative NIT2-nitrilase n=1 Tax=Mycotypha africana TaxID=64632 RepID=UPI00230098C5|nr:putative NIT2-nitrilase [Mycotypha africana]KAI8967593.1 putative NIT2-nitrilase [Mycotypha africana]
MVLIAVGQICATASISFNKAQCCKLVHQASSLGAKMIFLPEAADFISHSRDEALQLTTPIDNSEFVSALKASAKENCMWISVGIHESADAGTTNDNRLEVIKQKIFNTHIVINEEGELLARYRKVHLFNVDLVGLRLMESDTTLAGDKLIDPIHTPAGMLGLQTCYDMRFAESSIALRKRGAELLAYPSAFTIKTGMAHWETLLRARAIETQTYVIASAQIGAHNEKRSSYGNAMIVDPWGTVIARCPDNHHEPTLAVGNIDVDYLNKIRLEMPVMAHRRNDIYPAIE